MTAARFSCPSEQRLTRLIGEAYGGMQGADSARLAAIEARILAESRPRLGRRREARGLIWWVGGLLLAGAAAGAWWAAEVRYQSEAPPAEPVVEGPRGKVTEERLGESRRTEPEPGAGMGTDRAVIDRREAY